MTTQMRGLEAVACVTGPWDRFGALSDRMASAIIPLFTRYHVGVAPERVIEYLHRACGYVATLASEVSIGPPNDIQRRFRALTCIHSDRILPRIFGSALITAGYEHRLEPSRRIEAFTTQVLYETLQNVLDDLLDHGGYSFDSACELYRLCSGRLEGEISDYATLEAALTQVLRADHQAAAPILASISIEVGERLRASPRTPYLSHQMDIEDEAIAQAQTATVFLREESFDLTALAAQTRSIWSPERGATWLERLAGHSAWVGYLSLIAMCYTDPPATPREIDEHQAVWFDMNFAMSFFDHVAGIEKDRRDGVLNFAAAVVAEARGVSDPNLVSWTRREMHSILERGAQAASRGIARAQRSLDSEAGFYPMLAAMSAIVLSGPGTRNETWCLPVFLARLEAGSDSPPARAIESARGGDVAQVRFTIPPGIHSTGLLSGRIASS